MTTLRRLFARFAAVASGLVSARSAAAALESGRRPNDIDLMTLGIDPRAFEAIRKA